MLTYYSLSALSVLAAYLIGAIPFGYLIALWARGIDIRKVGSGNIGATNVGRTLGFRFFVIVFTLDLLKGFLPAYGLPRLVQAATGQGAETLGVLAALAAILGHNFPVYLGFRGGKGVATSLGALLALDATAALSSLGGFIASMLATRYVSVSSLCGGIVFAAVHFARSGAPFRRDQIAMSLLTIGLLVLLVVRHRKNLARLRAGTEPRVPLFRRQKPPEGRMSGLLLAVVVVATVLVVLASGLAAHAGRRAELSLGRWTLTEVTRVATGHQRADRLAFADRGRLLAVTCPRYNRIVLYDVTTGESLELHREIRLEGHPVAVCPVGDRLYILQRPDGDARHIEPGYWEAYDFEGRRIGSRFRVGFYPDDLTIAPDGRHALVLTSGSGEGEANRPRPALAVVALGDDAGAGREVGRVEFDRHGDDPERLALSTTGRWANVSLRGSNQVATIDLSDPTRPRIVERTDRAKADGPAPLAVAGDNFANPVSREGEAIQLDLPELGSCVAYTRTKVSGLELYEAASRRPLGRLQLLGALNLSPTRPTGVAYAAGRGLIAVATRSGSVHLIAIRPVADRSEALAAGSGIGRR